MRLVSFLCGARGFLHFAKIILFLFVTKHICVCRVEVSFTFYLHLNSIMYSVMN